LSGRLGVEVYVGPAQHTRFRVREFLILGTDRQDAETHRDLWLSQNPSIQVVKVHEVKPAPLSLLMRIGSRDVPRVSILVEYLAPDENLRTAPAPDGSPGE
jgi:hypothetical protein